MLHIQAPVPPPDHRRMDSDILTGGHAEGSTDLAMRVRQAATILHTGRLANLRPLLGLFLNLEGLPYTLDDYFPFEPFFSTQMPRRIVLKTGRQVSKTLAISGQQKVLLATGRRVYGHELKSGDRIIAVDDNYRATAETVLDVILSGKKPVLRVTTRTGAVLDLAVTHPLLKLSGWTVGSSLRVGDRIAALRRGGRFGRRQVSLSRIITTAYMLGDGSCCDTFNFTNNCQAVCREFIDTAQALQALEVRNNGKHGTTCRSIGLSKESKLAAWLKTDGLWGKRAWEKFLPAWVFDLSRSHTALFISRLWATDGMVKQDKTKPQITYCSTSREMAYDVKSLLLKFGIPTAIKQRKSGYRSKKTGKFVRCRDAYIVRVETREGWQRFLDSFDVPGKPGFVLRDVSENNNRDTVPLEIRDLIAEIAGECRGTDGPSLFRQSLRKKPKYPLSYAKLRDYVAFFRRNRNEHPRLQELERLLDGDVLWDEIVSIEPIGKHSCWDIEVSGEHNYVLDGLLSHNSTSLAAQGIIVSNTLPYFNTLYVTPQYELIRRFSTNYVARFVQESPFRSLMVDSTTTQNVLQRSFRNHSTMHFSFAFLDADRTRGIPAAKVGYDEVQDMDPDFIPIIRETMSGSRRWGIEQFAGTPKTIDGCLERLWRRTSQAEWHIKCRACNHENIPTLEADLERMIGPSYVTREISERYPGVVCGKCSRPIYPRTGVWVHHHADKRMDFAGYHVPQIIMPIHYSDPEKWLMLVGKRDGFAGTADYMFYNEVCGISYDMGAKLITQTELIAACTDRPNSLAYAKGHIGNYIYRICAVDWGGGGEDEISFTVATVLGMRPDGKIDVLFAWRSKFPHNHNAEAVIIMKIMQAWKCTHMVHDYSGAGSIRETVLTDAGFPIERLIPIAMVRANVGSMLKYITENLRTGQRQHFRLDKARSLVQTCELIRYGQIKFFRYDNVDDTPGLIDDFLSLTEDLTDQRLGGSLYTIIRNEKAGPDDFANAVNIGICALYYMRGEWPNLRAIAAIANRNQPILKILQQIEDAINWDEHGPAEIQSNRKVEVASRGALVSGAKQTMQARQANRRQTHRAKPKIAEKPA